MNLLITTINFNYSQNIPTGVTLHYRANKQDRSAENSGFIEISVAEFSQSKFDELAQLVREKVAEDILAVPKNDEPEEEE